MALLGSVLVATPVQALSDTGTGGVFTPASGKVLDTRDGTGGYSTPMAAGSYRTVKVAGVGALPDDGSVGAVTVDVTSVSPSAQGQVFLRPNDATSTTLGVVYAATGSTTNTVTVAVDTDGTIQVAATTAAGLVIELQGYYSANTDGIAPGGFVSVPGKNLVDTRAGTGAPQAQIANGGSLTVQVAGQAGIPSNASGVVATFVAINGTATAGYLTPYAADEAKPARGLNYAASMSTAVSAQIGLSADGEITIANSKTATNLVIDIQGYFTATGKGGAVFTPAAGRLLDTRATGQSIVGQNETRVIRVAGQAGVPVHTAWYREGINPFSAPEVVRHATVRDAEERPRKSRRSAWTVTPTPKPESVRQAFPPRDGSARWGDDASLPDLDGVDHRPAHCGPGGLDRRGGSHRLRAVAAAAGCGRRSRSGRDVPDRAGAARRPTAGTGAPCATGLTPRVADPVFEVVRRRSDGS
jgi:hypothetical protein